MLSNSYKAFVNLDSRPDRLAHMKEQLSRMGLEAERVRGLLPHEVNQPPRKVAVMQRRTPGAIGCHYSQVSIMEEALKRKQNAFVMEDDLVFCSDFMDRITYIEKFLDGREWDVFWLGGTFHSPAHWHATKHNWELSQCNCNLGKDCEPTEDPRIIRTYGAFCTYAYIVNIKSLEKILSLLDDNVHLSMGIDWLFILLQPNLKTYAFVPGSVKQMDNQSNIGDGITVFSGFSKLNGSEENSKYWYQENMNDFDPLTYNWQ